MTVRLGFLGCGFIAGYHAAMLAGSTRTTVNPAPAATIAAVYDPDPQRAAAFAERHGALVMDSPAAVIEATDAVYVATWTAEHPRLVEQVAAAGRAVFCEKPLATSAAVARAMAEVVDRAGIVNQVGLVLRDSPAFLLLRHLVQRPESGRLMSIVFRDDQFLPVQGLYASDWRADVTRAGAGTLLEHSIHDLDLLEWIGGPVAEVAARTASFHGIEGIEDLAAVTLAFAGGALATLTSVWHDVLVRPSMRHVQVFCERAYYVVEGDVWGPVRWTVQDRDPDGEAPVPDRFVGTGALEAADLLAAVGALGLSARNADAAFVEAVRTGSPAYPAIADAVHAHVLADAAYRSASDREGAPGCPVATPTH